MRFIRILSFFDTPDETSQHVVFLSIRRVATENTRPCDDMAPTEKIVMATSSDGIKYRLYARVYEYPIFSLIYNTTQNLTYLVY